MNSALNQELMDPSKFNLIAASTLIVLILLCVIVIFLSIFKKSNYEKDSFNSTIKGKGKGKGF